MIERKSIVRVKHNLWLKRPKVPLLGIYSHALYVYLHVSFLDTVVCLPSVRDYHMYQFNPPSKGIATRKDGITSLAAKFIPLMFLISIVRYNVSQSKATNNFQDDWLLTLFLCRVSSDFRKKLISQTSQK